MKKKINMRFLTVTAVAIITIVSMATVVFYELFKKEVMQDIKTYARVLVAVDVYNNYESYDFSKDLEELRVQ